MDCNTFAKHPLTTLNPKHDKTYVHHKAIDKNNQGQGNHTFVFKYTNVNSETTHFFPKYTNDNETTHLFSNILCKSNIIT